MLKEQSNQHPNKNPQKKKLQNHKLKKAIIAAVAVLVVGGIAWAKLAGGKGNSDAEALFTVKRGDLLISVLESGKIQANKSVDLMCEVEGQSTIISIVPEGTDVKKGDVLIELDSSDLRERIDQQEITVRTAESALTQAIEAYEIQENQNESDIKAAQLKVDFAKIDLTKYTEGDWPQQKMKAENEILTAKTALKLEEEKLLGTRELAKKDYVTQTDLEAQEFQYEIRQITLNEAINGLELLKKYDNPKSLQKLTADHEEAVKELGRAIRRAKSQTAQKEADRDAKQATYDMQDARFKKLKTQLEKTTILAPQPGLVIYASSTGDRFRRDRGLIAEGENVYERQKLIQLPDVTTMKVDVTVHESVRDMIQPNQRAIITVEAIPGLTLHGHVEKVAILPDSGSHWMNPDLTVYATSILIDDVSEALKPGMTAKAEIIVASLKDAIYVPVQAVSIRDEREVCFVVDGSKMKVVPVKVGLSSDNYIEIKSGLKEGDKVLTYAPIAAESEKRLPKRKDLEGMEEGAPTPGTESTQEGSGRTPGGSPGGSGRVPEGASEGAATDMGAKAASFLQNMTPEQKKALQERMKAMGMEVDLENMTPEQMREIGRMMRERGGGRPRTPGEGGQGPGRRPGGPGGGGAPGEGSGGRRPPRAEGGTGGQQGQ